MSPEEIERQARALYDDCPTVKPDWAQLGDTTKSVWREMVQARASATATAPAPVPQALLF